MVLEKLVEEFAKLPGIGHKTAQRLTMHVLNLPQDEVREFANALIQARGKIKYCSICGNFTEQDPCAICGNPYRDKSIICVVEHPKDINFLEKVKEFNGVYHVLGGIISPLDGIGPDQLTIDSLVQRIDKEEITEIIFALNATIQGDTTIYYIGKKLKAYPVKITTIARGIAFGGELEYADEMTLAKSISNRIPVENYIN